MMVPDHFTSKGLVVVNLGAVATNDFWTAQTFLIHGRLCRHADNI